MRATRTWMGGVGALALVAALAGCGGSSSSDSTSGSTSSAGASTSSGGSTAAAENKDPIVIGAAIDFSNFMAPTDDPALYGAQIQADKINAAGGVDGRQIVIKTKNTKIKPDVSRAAALDFVNDGADVLWVTCDVDIATPAIQVGLEHKVLTIAPCIGTDQMGPKRFGEAGKLAFSYGNVAQDEGAADAQIAWHEGWKTANVAVDKQLVYEQDVCQAFTDKFTELGGKVLTTQTWTQGDHTVGNVATKLNGSKADVNMVCTTAAPDVSTLLTNIRSIGNDTPILAPWSLDGTYWMPKDPKIATNVWTDSYTSIYGDDPSKDVQDMIAKLKQEGHAPTTGGFVAGAAAIDGIVAAIKQNGGSTDGTKLAATMEGFQNLPTISGNVNFSPDLHTVSGRDYRVLEVTGGKGKFMYLVNANGDIKKG